MIGRSASGEQFGVAFLFRDWIGVCLMEGDLKYFMKKLRKLGGFELIKKIKKKIFRET